MTQEDKDLLLRDLCGRLPYGVKVYDTKSSINVSYMNLCHINGIINEVFISSGMICRTAPIEDIKPYLFPMSSITEKQEEELKNIYYGFNGMLQYTERIFDEIPFSKMKYFPYQIEEFFNKNHIDYRGLIPKGLANDATNLNIY